MFRSRPQQRPTRQHTPNPQQVDLDTDFRLGNTTFRCRNCRQTRHLHNMCPEAKKDTRRKKILGKQAKGWKYPPPEPEEEEGDAEDETSPKGNNQTTTEPKSQGGTPQDPSETQEQPVQIDIIPEEGDIIGNKRIHSSDNSDSDKDMPNMMQRIRLH